MALSWQAVSAHKLPIWGMRSHKALKTETADQVLRAEWGRSLARSRVVLRLASLATRTGEELARWLVHITGHGCASIKKNWLFLLSTFFVESRFDFHHCRGSGFWERGFICRTVASNRAHVYHVLAAAPHPPPLENNRRGRPSQFPMETLQGRSCQ